MTQYMIICITLSSDQNNIERVGLTSDSFSNIVRRFATPKELNQLLQNGDKCYFTGMYGQRAEVEPYGDDFIRTSGDKTLINNLRHLHRC